jgi:hypothetical protein
MDVRGELRPHILTPSAVNLHIIPLMMEAEMVSETMGFHPQLTQLVDREDFIEFGRRESFKSIMNLLFFYALFDFVERLVYRLIVMIVSILWVCMNNLSIFVCVNLVCDDLLFNMYILSPNNDSDLFPQ